MIVEIFSFFSEIHLHTCNFMLYVILQIFYSARLVQMDFSFEPIPKINYGDVRLFWGNPDWNYPVVEGTQFLTRSWSTNETLRHFSGSYFMLTLGCLLYTLFLNIYVRISIHVCLLILPGTWSTALKCLLKK